MSNCVEKISCEKCGSSDANQVFEEEGDYTAYCFHCGVYEPNPYKNKPSGYKPPNTIIKSPDDIARELYDIWGFPAIAVPSRGLEKSTIEYFGIRVGVSESDGETPNLLYFPYTHEGTVVGYKAKLLAPKKMWSHGDQKDVDPCGWSQALVTGSPKLIITEGEPDMAALWQMIRASNQNSAYADLIPAVISLPHGAASAVRDLLKISHLASLKFKEIILAFDMDDAGQEAANKVIKEVFPNAKIAHMPAKDANACLMGGRSKACVKSVLWNSVVPKNTRIVRGSSLREQARTRPEWGLPYPWDGLTRHTRGRRRGETIYFGAGVKMGKSELVNALAKQIIVDDGIPCLIIKPEESMAKTYNLLVGKAAGRIFHDPNITFDEAAFDAAEPLIGDKALILDSYQFVDWKTLRGDIQYAVVSEGVKDVIIDPITALTNTLSASEANEFLVNFAADLSQMAKDLDFTAYIFCHLKAPTQGESHERGGLVLSHQFAGSRAMMRSCNYMIGLQGNKDPDLTLEQRNMRKIIILEDREFGSSGSVDLYWDWKTGLFNEVRV